VLFSAMPCAASQCRALRVNDALRLIGRPHAGTDIGLKESGHRGTEWP
jgi:hypothetical protein